jgi:cysteine-rich repeat protein
MRIYLAALAALLIQSCTVDTACKPERRSTHSTLELWHQRAFLLQTGGQVGGRTRRLEATVRVPGGLALVLEPEASCAEVGCSRRLLGALRSAEVGEVLSNGATVLGRWPDGVAALTLTTQDPGYLVFVRLDAALPAAAEARLDGFRQPSSCMDFGYMALKGVSERSLCGDGFVDPGEPCDDGNAEYSDGCGYSGARCQVNGPSCGAAPGEVRVWRCVGEPSVCTLEACGADCALGPASAVTRALWVGRVMGDDQPEAAVAVLPGGVRCAASVGLVVGETCIADAACAALQPDGALMDWVGCGQPDADGRCRLENPDRSRSAEARFALDMQGVQRPEQVAQPLLARVASSEGGWVEAAALGAPAQGSVVHRYRANGERQWAVRVSTPVRSVVAGDLGGVWLAARVQAVWSVGDRTGNTQVAHEAPAPWAVVVARVNRSGEVSRPIVLGEAEGFEPEHLHLVALPADDGVARVGLYTAAREGVVLRELRGDGQRGWQQVLAQGAQLSAPIALPDGRVVLGWVEAEQVQVAVYGADGVLDWTQGWPVAQADQAPALGYDAEAAQVLVVGPVQAGWALRRYELDGAAPAEAADQPIEAEACTTWRAVVPALDGAWIVAGHCAISGDYTRVLRLDAAGGAQWVEHLGGAQHAPASVVAAAAEGDTLWLFGRFGAADVGLHGSVRLDP